MASIPVGHALRVPRLVLSVGDSVETARSRLAEASLPGAPVLGRGRALKGTISLDELTGADATAQLGDLPLNGPIVTVDDGLDDALAQLADAHRSWAPVTANDELVGVISVGDILGAYRTALAANVRQVRSAGPSGSLVEAEVTPRSTLVGRAVAAAPWPRETVLVSIARGDRIIVPRGDVELAAGDRLTIYATPAARDPLAELLATAVPIPSAPS